MQRLYQHGISQQPRIKLLMMQQTGYACDRGFLLAIIACQLGLTGGLLLHDRRDEVADDFVLMTVCPGQQKRDRLTQTSRERVLRCHTQRLSQGPSPWLLVTSENVARDHRHSDGWLRAAAVHLGSTPTLLFSQDEISSNKWSTPPGKRCRWRRKCTGGPEQCCGHRLGHRHCCGLQATPLRLLQSFHPRFVESDIGAQEIGH